jgi:endonuclease YncB( thermonuclease family)
VAEGGALLRRYTGLNRYRGFESLSLRHAFLAALLAAAAGAARAETFEANVVAVPDGDSISVMVGRQRVKVRLAGIDAPERKQRFGNESRQALARLCRNTKARVAWTEKDDYQRLLGRVSCAGTDANAEQVRQGMAWVRYKQQYPQLSGLQDAARRERRGLWTQHAPTPPWDWRRRNPDKLK